MRSLVPLSLFLAATVSCGPLVTEPMPDIPETVEYKTIRLEYGTDDLLPESDRLQQELVGDASGMAALTRLVVRSTNRSIRDQIRLVEAIKAFPPTNIQETAWTWEHQGEEYAKLDLWRDDDDPELVKYAFLTGETISLAAVVLSGEFRSFGRTEGGQHGEGHLRFEFDNARNLEAEGTIQIAFRVAGDVRQVRVGLYHFRESPDVEPNTALYEYVQFAGGDGTFSYGAVQDFLKDGEPLEHVSITAAWNAEQVGRASARVEDGSATEVITLQECWDAAGRIVFADATPDLPGYDDGEFSDCDPALQELDLTPPTVLEPDGELEPPSPHPAESAD